MLAPKVLIVELTNHCNLHCPFCTTNLAMHRKRGFMDFEVFKKLIAELKGKNHYPMISMNMCGEPLLHNQVDKFVEEASINGFSTYISTNVSQLDQNMSERLIMAGLNSIALCLDGFSKESHETYRIGSNFDQIKANCEGFLDARKRLNLQNPRVIIQTLLTSYSENEINDILSWSWRNGADEVFFKTISIGSSTSVEQRKQGEKLLPTNPVYKRRYIASRTKCPMPEEHIIIYWNGQIGVCCIDFNNISNLSSITDMSLYDLLNDSDVIKARRSAFNKENDLCRICRSADETFRGFRISFDQDGLTYNPDILEPDWKTVVEEQISKIRSA